MNRISHFTLAALLLVSLAQLTAADQKTSAVDSLEQGFLSPPESAKPKTWWHWMSGCVSREGITADLEAMKKAGLGLGSQRC